MSDQSELDRLRAELQTVTRERDEAHASAERFRESMYAVEEKFLRELARATAAETALAAANETIGMLCEALETWQSIKRASRVASAELCDPAPESPR